MTFESDISGQSGPFYTHFTHLKKKLSALFFHFEGLPKCISLHQFTEEQQDTEAQTVPQERQAGPGTHRDTSDRLLRLTLLGRLRPEHKQS